VSSNFHTVLMGDPTHFSVVGGANPHTRDRWGRRKRVDRALAIQQWGELRRTLAVRYRGQAFDLPVAWRRGDDVAAAFHHLHRTRYGHAREDEPAEIVTARVAAVGRTSEPRLADHRPVGQAEPRRRRVGLANGKWVEAEAWRWEGLAPGHASEAPALVLGDHATALVPPGWSWRVGRRGDLHLERR